MSADVPLLNDYKKSFVKRRMLQTFLGGLHISRKGTRWWLAVPQILLFLIPSLTSIPFTFILENTGDQQDAR